RVLGRQPNIDVDLAEVPVQPGDYLVLCSDGLTRMVSDQMLAETITELRDPQRICDHLIGAANRNGGADNITVVVVQVALTWWRRLSNRWSGQVRGGEMASLTLQFEDRVLKAYALGPITTIGRLPDNTVTIDSRALSSHH